MSDAADSDLVLDEIANQLDGRTRRVVERLEES